MKKQSTGKLRIIGGKWRSRLLPVLDLPGLRPTTDRIRETIFNWLQSDIGGANCLDCFAGSGALGFEAASRGAKNVLMLELQNQAAKVLNENISALQADNVQVQQQDALKFLSGSPTEKMDIVFLDPPFDSEFLPPACVLLEDNSWLSERAYIYIEIDSKQVLPAMPENWDVKKEKKAGQVSYYLLQRDL